MEVDDIYDLGPAELRELVHEVSDPALRVHYQETSFWWADWIHDPVYCERLPYNAVPDRERLAQAESKGSFLL